jgi:hypothetical protein
MESSQTSSSSSSPTKTNYMKRSIIVKKNSNSEFGALSDYGGNISPVKYRAITPENLNIFLRALAENIYETDRLKIK